MYPFFFIGIALADLETSPVRPLDRLRNMSMWWKVPFNLLLITLFVLYGSNSNDGSEHCHTAVDEQCPFYKWITVGNFIEQV